MVNINNKDVEEEEEEEEEKPIRSMAQQIADRRANSLGFVPSQQEKDAKHPITAMFDVLFNDGADDESSPGKLTESSVLNLISLSRIKSSQIEAIAQMLAMDRRANTDIHKRIIRYMLAPGIGEKGAGRKEMLDGLRDIRLHNEEDEEGDRRL